MVCRVSSLSRIWVLGVLLQACPIFCSADVLGTIDYVDETDGTIVFRTCAKERDRVVLQVGTSDPDRALRVGKLV